MQMKMGPMPFDTVEKRVFFVALIGTLLFVGSLLTWHFWPDQNSSPPRCIKYCALCAAFWRPGSYRECFCRECNLSTNALEWEPR